MKVGIFITVRIDSTRLPKKALLEVNGKHIIEYLIQRIKYINRDLAEVYICTTDNKEDLVFDKIAEMNKIKIFHGDYKNIIKRHYDCAVYNNIDFIVNVDGDDILCDPEYINKIIRQAIEDKNYDVIKTEGLIFGTNSIGYKLDVLRKILKEYSYEKLETGWGELINNCKIFNIKKIIEKSQKNFNIRLTLDYIDDFEVFENIINNVFINQEYVSQEKIINYLLNNLEVVKKNSYLNDIYWENFNNKKREEGR